MSIKAFGLGVGKEKTIGWEENLAPSNGSKVRGKREVAGVDLPVKWQDHWSLGGESPRFSVRFPSWCAGP